LLQFSSPGCSEKSGDNDNKIDINAKKTPLKIVAHEHKYCIGINCENSFLKIDTDENKNKRKKDQKSKAESKKK